MNPFTKLFEFSKHGRIPNISNYLKISALFTFTKLLKI